MDEYTRDGLATLRTYASVLTALMEELSEEELAECQEMAVRWNMEPAPREIQRKWVVVSYCQKITHNGIVGQQRGFQPWQRSSWILLGRRWVSGYSCLFNTRMWMKMVPSPSKSHPFHWSGIIVTYCCHRFETQGSTITADNPNWRQGPRNILNMWKDWTKSKQFLHPTIVQNQY